VLLTLLFIIPSSYRQCLAWLTTRQHTVSGRLISWTSWRVWGAFSLFFFIWKLQQGDNSPPDFIDHSSGNMITQEFTAIFCESLYGPGLHLASVHRKIKNSRPVINDFFCFSSAFWLSSDWPRLCRIELAALELGAHHGRRFHFSFSIAASNRGWWSAVLVVRNAADPLNAMQISSLKTWV
jgi:hypothetical protein